MEAVGRSRCSKNWFRSYQPFPSSAGITVGVRRVEADACPALRRGLCLSHGAGTLRCRLKKTAVAGSASV